MLSTILSTLHPLLSQVPVKTGEFGGTGEFSFPVNIIYYYFMLIFIFTFFCLLKYFLFTQENLQINEIRIIKDI
jgi:hypothetical protein